LKIRRAAIKEISTYLPSGVLTNEQLAKEFIDWDVDKIFNKTGIAKRHIANSTECASDLGVAAAEKLFGSGSYKSDSVDFLLFCTETPDYFVPASACIIHERLG
jgi:3-oxoacyl-[acyl-carrier-protein] synthase-3